MLVQRADCIYREGRERKEEQRGSIEGGREEGRKTEDGWEGEDVCKEGVRERRKIRERERGRKKSVKERE